jgi:hypothetical protein
LPHSVGVDGFLITLRALKRSKRCDMYVRRQTFFYARRSGKSARLRERRD